MNVKDGTYVISGEVLKLDDQRYSSTHVSGGGGYVSGRGGHVSGYISSVESTVTHHLHQKLWLKTSDGYEECVHIEDGNVDAREGHHVSLVASKRSRQFMRFFNRTTGRHSVLKDESTTLGPIASVLLLPLVALIPVLNMVWALSKGFNRGEHFTSAYNSTVMLRMALVALISLSYAVSFAVFWHYRSVYDQLRDIPSEGYSEPSLADLNNIDPLFRFQFLVPYENIKNINDIFKPRLLEIIRESIMLSDTEFKGRYALGLKYTSIREILRGFEYIQHAWLLPYLIFCISAIPIGILINWQSRFIEALQARELNKICIA